MYDRTGVDLHDGELAGLLRIDSTIEPVSLGFTITGIMGGSDDTSGCSAMGATCVDTTCSEACKFATTCSKLRVAKLSCVAAV